MACQATPLVAQGLVTVRGQREVPDGVPVDDRSGQRIPDGAQMTSQAEEVIARIGTIAEGQECPDAGEEDDAARDKQRADASLDPRSTRKAPEVPGSSSPTLRNTQLVHRRQAARPGLSSGHTAEHGRWKTTQSVLRLCRVSRKSPQTPFEPPRLPRRR